MAPRWLGVAQELPTCVVSLGKFVCRWLLFLDEKRSKVVDRGDSLTSGGRDKLPQWRLGFTSCGESELRQNKSLCLCIYILVWICLIPTLAPWLLGGFCLCLCVQGLGDPVQEHPLSIPYKFGLNILAQTQSTLLLALCRTKSAVPVFQNRCD